jgi:hypothetical protein
MGGLPTLNISEARRLRICRVCRQAAAPRVPDHLREASGPAIVAAYERGEIDAFVYNFGEEYAHASCIRKIRHDDD